MFTPDLRIFSIFAASAHPPWLSITLALSLMLFWYEAVMRDSDTPRTFDIS